MSGDPRIIPVILSGGAGTRLWPLSRLGRPKQLLALAGEESLLRQTARRAAAWGEPVVVTGAAEAEAVGAELPAAKLIVEPAARNTAPAIALAALAADPDSLLLVMPSDHHIADEQAFRAVVERGVDAAAQGWLVTFGIEPDRPETGYGYIRAGAALAGGACVAERFAEKPDLPTAQAFLAEGGWAWNAGIFLMRADSFLAALQEHSPEIADAVRDGRFAEAPAVSIDKAVMEKAGRVAVVPASMGWSDIGSWEALHALGPHDADGNVVAGDVAAPGSRGCLVRSDGPTVVALGVEDLVVVATERAVLVVRRSDSQRVKEAIDALAARERKAP